MMTLCWGRRLALGVWMALVAAGPSAAIAAPTSDVAAGDAAGAGAAPAAAAAALPAAPAREMRMRDDVALQVGSTLRCPVCQGMPIAESPATMAQDMMRKVRRMLAAGQSPAQVQQYFVERYGEWVLLEPKPRGITLWVWVLPPAVLLLGGALALLHARRTHGAPAPSSSGVGVPKAADDPYLAAIQRQVDE